MKITFTWNLDVQTDIVVHREVTLPKIFSIPWKTFYIKQKNLYCLVWVQVPTITNSYTCKNLFRNMTNYKKLIRIKWWWGISKKPKADSMVNGLESPSHLVSVQKPGFEWRHHNGLVSSDVIRMVWTEINARKVWFLRTGNRDTHCRTTERRNQNLSL